jgi:hypothetical protein
MGILSFVEQEYRSSRMHRTEKGISKAAATGANISPKLPQCKKTAARGAKVPADSLYVYKNSRVTRSLSIRNLK